MMWRLADGVVAHLAASGPQLLDVRTGRKLLLPPDAEQVLERLAWHGETFAAAPQLAESLAAYNFIVAGSPQPDPFLAAALRRLDGEASGGAPCGGAGRAGAAYEAVVAAHARRKRFFAGAGQLAVLPETAWRRAWLLGDAERVGARRVVCVGDDDMVSIALAALGHAVTVYDVDAALLQSIAATSRDLGLTELTTVHHDLCQPLPPPDRARFDCFFSDPMPNRACLELFLSRGLAMLRPGGTGYVAVAPASGRLLRQIVEQFGCVVRRHHRRFNRYHSYDFGLHPYESDWVEIAPPAAGAAQLAYSAESGVASSAQLYRDDYYRRQDLSVITLEAISHAHYAQPEYFHLLLDQLESTLGASFLSRQVAQSEQGVVYHCASAAGHLTVRCELEHRRLTAIAAPLSTELSAALRQLLLLAFKDGAVRHAQVCSQSPIWDERYR